MKNNDLIKILQKGLKGNVPDVSEYIKTAEINDSHKITEKINENKPFAALFKKKAFSFSAICILIILISSSIIFTYSKDNVSEIESAKQEIADISGLPLDNQIIDEKFKAESPDIIRIKNNYASYEYDMINNRIVIMRNNSSKLLYSKPRDNNKFNQDNAIETARNNIDKFNTVIKNPILFKCEYEDARNHYIITFWDQINEGFTTGNVIIFEISNEGDIIAVINSYEDISVTQNVDLNETISKDDVIKIIAADDKQGYLHLNDLKLTLTSYKNILAWDVRSASDPLIPLIYKVDARTGMILKK